MSCAQGRGCSFMPSPDNLIGSESRASTHQACSIRPEPIMSRSRRKTPICGITTAASEHFDKQIWHQAYRKAVRQRLATNPHQDSPHLREFFNPWSMGKDGKRYWGVRHLGAKWLRK